MAEPVDFVATRLTGPGFEGVTVKPVDGDDAAADVTCK
jgi:hypothetical protein